MPALRHPARPRRTALAGVATALCAVLLAGCGSDDGSATDESPGASPSETSQAPEATATPEATPTDESSGQQVEVDLTGGSTPDAQSVEVTSGEPVTLVVRADAAGELHVHSTPEQDLDYPAGRSEHPLVLDRPGVVDVESHDLGVVLVRLEVR